MEQAITDEIGRLLRLPSLPDRVVSLVPSLTEWLFAIGLGPRVVGVTDFCTRTGTTSGVERIGGTKNPNRAAIVALRPDVVIANREENRERDILALEQAGICVYVTDPRTVAGAIDTLARLARLVGAASVAEPLLGPMRAAHDHAVAVLNDRPRRVLALIWRDPWMAIGADTYADDMLRLAGGYNVAKALPGRYPRLDVQAFAALDPELVLLPSEPYSFSERDLPALHGVWSGEARFVDGELLTWYGPRIPLALRALTDSIRS